MTTLLIGTFMTRAALDADAKWIIVAFGGATLVVEILLFVIGHWDGERNGLYKAKALFDSGS